MVLAVSGAARSAEPVEGTGTSTVTITPAALGVDLPVGTDVDAALARLSLEATNVGGGVATLVLEGLTLNDQSVAPLAVSSVDGDKEGDEGQELSVAGFSALVGLVDYAVTAGDGTARSGVGALSAAVETPIGLDLGLDAQEVASSVTKTGTASEVVLNVSGLELGLGDLLPADLLAGLPLGVVLELIEGLDIAVPGDLAELIAAVEALVPTLEDTIAAIGDLEAAEDELTALIADSPTLAALQDAVDDAAAAVVTATTNVATATQAVVDAQAAVDALEASIAALEAEAETLDPLDPLDAARLLEIAADLLVLEDDLADAEATLLAAQDDLAAAEAALAQAEQDLADAEAALLAGIEDVAAALVAEIERLQAIVDDLLAQLTDLLVGLDLLDLRLDLVDLLLDTPVLDLGAMVLDLRTEADGTSSLGTATCTVGETRVLGAVVPVPDCAALDGALTSVTDALATVLDVLPLSVPVPTVTASGPTVTSSGAGTVDELGRTAASAEVSPLRLDVPSVALTSVVDDLVADLEALVAELLSEVDLLANTGYSAADVTLPASLDALVAELLASLDALPLGDALDGLRTLGVGASAGTVALSSGFTAQQGAEPDDGDPGDGTGGPGDTSGGPASTPSGTLPRTGLDLGTALAAAVAALAAGGVAMGARRELEMA